MRTASPEIVTRASIRTVAFETDVFPSPFCEVPHAVIQRPDPWAWAPPVQVNTASRPAATKLQPSREPLAIFLIACLSFLLAERHGRTDPWRRGSTRNKQLWMANLARKCCRDYS